MSGRKLFLAATVMVCLCGVGAAWAQGEGEAPAMSIRPVEIYGCEFREGQGWSQFAHVTARWNAWMDANGAHDYWAYQLVPLYHSSALTFDVLWAGGWASGAAMGAGLEQWVTEGGELQGEFDRVVDCDTVINFAVLDLTPPREPLPGGPVSFSDCEIEEGHEFPEALAAVQAWIAYEAGHGIEASHFMLFPAFGEASDAEYDFKWVTASTWGAFGQGYDQYGTGGGWQKAQELFKDLLDCDSSRVYQSTLIRAMAMGE